MSTFAVWPMMFGSPVSVAAAETPRELVRSEFQLNRAQFDVASMQGADLSAFSSFLAECVNDLASSEVVQHFCDTARERYLIEFENDRPLDRLLRASRIMRDSMRLNATIGRENEPGLAARLLHVDAGLRKAAHAVFRARRSLPFVDSGGS